MENVRLLIWATFGMLLYMTYQAWVADHAPQPQTPTTSENSPVAPVAPGDAGVPQLPAANEETTAPVTGDAVPILDTPASDVSRSTAADIRVTTDVLELIVSTEGGTILDARLPRYPVAKDQPDKLVALLSTDVNELGLIQSGLNAAGADAKPDHHATYTSAAREYTLGSDDELIVPLTWRNEQGVVVEKTLRFSRGSYRIDITHHLTNTGNAEWRGAEYAQIQRRNREAERSMFNVDSYSFDGPIIYDGKKSDKLKRDDLLDDGAYAIEATAGWVADIEHHFLSALIPPTEGQYKFNVSVSGAVSLASFIKSSSVIVPPGGEHRFETTAFVGPKLQAQLEDIDPSLKLTVDYGWLTIISQPLFWLLAKVFSFVGNWGVAIILVTVLIKAVFYKLTEASGRSMAKMREIQPRMKALQDRYKDDKPALSQAMMDLYKREKVNPAAGCLPILIQMPFFLAFYWVLLESVEMRQAPFALWITDLSSRDPFFILPIIMGVAMLGQQRLNPTPADPVQAKVMQIMPIIFTVFFAFFPAGLVLYWVTNTLLSIAQQWYINKLVHEEATARKSGNNKKNKDKS